MKSRRSARVMASLCGDVCPDDGIDPRRLKRLEVASNDHRRKDRQLCKQVQRALTLALSAIGPRWDDPLVISSIAPAPDTTRLRVLLDGTQVAPARWGALLAHLKAQTGALRAEIAGEIHRKRVPGLLFAISPRGDEHD